MTEAQEALSIAVAGGHAAAEAETLNTLGMATIALGQVDEGLAHMQRTIEIARETDDLDTMTYGYSNMAEMLSLAGRTDEGLRVAKEGLAVMPARLRADHDWIALTVSEMAFLAGDWQTARTHLKAPPPSWLLGRQLMFRRLREAEQALGEGAEDATEEALEAIATLVAASPEPQWIALFGALRGELLRRRRDLDGARTAVAEALDRIELCTDDVARIARVTHIGMVVEADRAQRARDLREKPAEKDALAHARIHIDRLRAAADAGGPIERAWLALSNAELTRARGSSDAAKWLAAASEWEELARPYWVAIARWRAAEALVDGGDRPGAADAARPALETARELGSEWYMAEKTASVHVSRILSKLGVNTRTQAAAVAHRQHLD
jgi:tetratricopeptide (TPR) repeat protein